MKLTEIARIRREYTLEIMEKMRDNAASHNCLYQANMKAKHEGQVKASNKRLLKILGKMNKENGKGWKKELPTALWAHRTAKSQATRALPFSLVYGTEAVIKASGEAGRDCRNT